MNRNSTCAFDTCERTDIRARGLCNGHYGQFTRGVPLKPLQKNSRNKNKGPCSLDFCDLPAMNKGYCHTHYRQDYYNLPIREVNYEGNCDICGKWSVLDRDHDHSCCPVGKLPRCGNCERGDLCKECNKALGLVKDDTIILLKMMEYIVKTNREVYL